MQRRRITAWLLAPFAGASPAQPQPQPQSQVQAQAQASAVAAAQRAFMRLVVPYPAGGAPDTFARTLAPALSAGLGLPVLIENRPGASGLLAARALPARSTETPGLLYLSSGHVTLAAMDPRFDLLGELRPVLRLSSSPLVLAVPADSAHRSLQALIGEVQARPGQLSFGTAGQASPAHMAAGHLARALPGFRALHVPFKGAVESAVAVVGRQIDFAFLVLGTAAPLWRSGRLRALAVTSPHRSEVMPEVPTVAEAAIPGWTYQAWGGLAMRAGTGDDWVVRVAALARAAMAAPALVRLLVEAGSVATLSASPARFADELRDEIAAEVAVVRQLGIKLE